MKEAIQERAHRCGVELDDVAIELIAHHAAEVLVHNERLKLTTIVDPDEFVERHIGESLEGAAMLRSDASGDLLDLGSGNGYPALPIAATYPKLRPILVEAAQDKAAFLREHVGDGEVIDRQVQRLSDLEGIDSVRVITTRAMGNWERILPRIAPILHPDGVLLLWAGPSVAEIAEREAWSRYALVGRHLLPGRRQSWIWAFKTNRDA